MTTEKELQQQVNLLEEKLIEAKYQLANYRDITIQDAVIGDVLEDGSIVIDKQGNMALLAAPKSTEVRCQWSKEFREVFDNLKQEGLNPSQWFVPTKEQLRIAHTNCREHFASANYWSSTEFSSTSACFLSFYIGYFCTSTKASLCCVRAFRVVYF